MSDIEARALIMLAVAAPASAGIMAIASRNGWLKRLSGQVAAASVIYAVLLIALAPPLLAIAGSYQTAAVVWLAAFYAAPLALVRWLPARYPMRPAPASSASTSGGQGTINAYHVSFEYEEEDQDNDWICEPVGAAVGAAVVGDDDGGLREQERDEDRGGAGTGGTSALRLSEPAGADGRAISASSSGGGGSASADGRTDRDGAGQQSDGHRAGAAGNGAGDGVAIRAAVAAPDRRSGRRGRGRRLVGAMVPRTVTPGDGTGAGGYDAAGATVTASIAPAA